MLATLILGIAAGACVPYAEPHVRKALEEMLPSDTPLKREEALLVTFAVLLVGAAILSYVFGHGSAFALTLGGLIGLFWPRIVAAIRKRREPDYGDEL